jgi:hypothetical protein
MFNKKVYYKKYYHRNKEKLKEYQKTYLQQPEVKERKKKYYKDYRQKPEVKDKYKKYRQKPEVKERLKEYYELNKDRIKQQHKEWFKKWRIENLELARKISRDSRNKYYKKPENRRHELEYQRKKRLADPIYKERHYIRTYSNRKYKANKCYCCNGFGYGLHHYTEPYEIDKVIPLCSTCHKKVHDKVIQTQFNEEDTKKAIEQNYLQKL